MVHSLVKSFGLLSGGYLSNLRIVRPFCATRTDLLSYHEQDYVDYVLGSTDLLGSTSDIPSPETMGLEGVSYAYEYSIYATYDSAKQDCPPFPGLPQYVQLVAGASLTCATIVKEGHADVSINWDGGRWVWCFLEPSHSCINRLHA